MVEISLGAAPDGTLTYVMEEAPSTLPPVRGRDILAAWELAREAARKAAWGSARIFRFRRADGSWTVLTLRDRDARCWAGAVDRAVGLQTGYGLSVCLRLLALVDLLTRAPWAVRMVALDRPQAELHPALLRLAAESRLTDDATFDAACFQARLPSWPESAEAGAKTREGAHR